MTKQRSYDKIAAIKMAYAVRTPKGAYYPMYSVP